MPHAIVTPNKPWPEATHAKVQIMDKIIEHVKILRVTDAPKDVPIQRSEYPIGVVVLNDITPPNNSDPIELQTYLSNDVTEIIHVPGDGSWPCCYVILFTK